MATKKVALTMQEKRAIEYPRLSVLLCISLPFTKYASIYEVYASIPRFLNQTGPEIMPLLRYKAVDAR
ncbi:MAG: hypothetical protein KJO08_11015, partial [Gammaproteobacteria bacterium]|nr:hypothetical protein [Gammaproteobacteria bacterium]